MALTSGQLGPKCYEDVAKGGVPRNTPPFVMPS